MNNLKYQRVCVKEWSQKDLSLAAGIGKSYISLAEAGRFIPTQKGLTNLANALDWEGDPKTLLDEAPASLEIEKTVRKRRPRSILTSAQEERIREIIHEELCKPSLEGLHEVVFSACAEPKTEQCNE